MFNLRKNSQSFALNISKLRKKKKKEKEKPESPPPLSRLPQKALCLSMAKIALIKNKIKNEQMRRNSRFLVSTFTLYNMSLLKSKEVKKLMTNKIVATTIRL